MSNIVISILFGIVSTINNLFLAPLIYAILVIFPDMSNYINYFIYFLNDASTYVSTILRLLLFNRTMMLVLFTYFVMKWTIWVASCAIRSVLKVYNILKP